MASEFNLNAFSYFNDPALNSFDNYHLDTFYPNHDETLSMHLFPFNRFPVMNLDGLQSTKLKFT